MINERDTECAKSMNDEESGSPESEQSDDAMIGAAFHWSFALLVVIAVVGGGVAWWLTRPSPASLPNERELTLPTKRDTPTVAIPEMPFRDITAEAGIDFVHENGAYGDKLLPETMGGGCAFFDYDNDGDQDILLVNSERWPWDKRPQRASRRRSRSIATTATASLTMSHRIAASMCRCMAWAWPWAITTAMAGSMCSSAPSARAGCFATVRRQVRRRDDEAGVAGTDDDWGTSCGWFDY